ncbi:MAG: GtrA family protein [Rickettsiaceae bacterium]|nr:GtrA family protein [Rickettsiaceae bacterium]
MKTISNETWRFIFSGGLNTLTGYFLYLVLLSFSNYYIAYTISFLASILMAFFINSYYVFKVRILWGRLIQFQALYFLQYLIGLFFLYILILWFCVGQQIAPLVNAVLITPLSFIINKWFFSRGVI